ncbi:hypothetical protein KQX54_010049 [Cotesia glomerata]|uniref:Plus3 domain-containing protein n=1 Tax=Cotesia glomerata TaxID=32391 RepID=A0AAV7HST3_COTGL|nr:hypothetical protein KQX54_010049 [Cotesia glomerata]
MACKSPSVDTKSEEETDDLLNQPSEPSQLENSKKNDRKSKTSNRKNWCFNVGSINVEVSKLMKNNEFDDKLFRTAIQQLKFNLNIRCPVMVFGKIRENRSNRVAYLRCTAEKMKHDAEWKLDINEYLTSNGKMFDINCSSFKKISPCPVNPGETKFSQLRYEAREEAKEELRSKSARKVYYNHMKKTDLEQYREGHTQTVRSINTFHRVHSDDTLSDIKPLQSIDANDLLQLWVLKNKEDADSPIIRGTENNNSDLRDDHFRD